MGCVWHATVRGMPALLGGIGSGTQGRAGRPAAAGVTNSLLTGAPRVGEVRILCVAAIIPVRICGGLFIRL